ncbi:MAG TPA: hypothetical protein VE338_01665 [Ktedonobacterales bacterium]|jgi:hypothetical protein|nr:hypothetical protein [Ktedonobacterales bacterium]
MRADPHRSQPSQPFPPVDGRRFDFVEPLAPVDSGMGTTDVPVTFYVTRSVLASLQREAQGARASDWRAHAQRKLDAALARQALPLTPEQAEALQRYAETLDLEPQEVLLALIAPGVARRERLLRQGLAFARAHAPRRPSGCLMLAVWVAALIGLWNLAAWALSLAPLLLRH